MFPDFFLWGYLKFRVFSNKPRTLEALQKNIRQEIAAIQLETQKNYEKCGKTSTLRNSLSWRLFTRNYLPSQIEPSHKVSASQKCTTFQIITVGSNFIAILNSVNINGSPCILTVFKKMIDTVEMLEVQLLENLY